MSVYFIRRGPHIKVGSSTDVPRRLLQLQTANAEELQLLAVIPGDQWLEFRIHDLLSSYRVNGEWFRYIGPVRQFINVIAAGARPTSPDDLALWWDFATGPAALESAKRTIAHAESDHEQLRAAHIKLRDLGG